MYFEPGLEGGSSPGSSATRPPASSPGSWESSSPGSYNETGLKGWSSPQATVGTSAIPFRTGSYNEPVLKVSLYHLLPQAPFFLLESTLHFCSLSSTELELIPIFPPPFVKILAAPIYPRVSNFILYSGGIASLAHFVAKI